MEIYWKFHSITGIFQRTSPHLQNSDIEKCILMAASGNELILETFCMAASQKQLQTYIRFRNSYSYFTFLTWRHVKEDRIFIIFFK